MIQSYRFPSLAQGPKVIFPKLLQRLFFGLLLGYLCASYSAHAQVPVALMPVPKPQFFDQTGLPLAFGCVFTYQTGTTTPLATYTDSTGTVLNLNPVLLNASGFPANGSGIGGIYIQTGTAYTIVVVSTGGSNCASGSTQYTVDGIGGGGTQLSTVVTPSGGSASFTDQAQNQLFSLTLTGNVTSLPMTATGIIPPGLVTFEITQDGAGAHIFTWPANVASAAPVCPTANCVTQQTFLWNGANAIAIGTASYSTPAFAVQNFFDYGLSANSVVCVNSIFELTTSCGSAGAVTYNGQVVSLNGTGNVNAGAATHSLAINEGNGNAIGGTALGASQIPVGVAGADPVASTLPTCNGQALTFSGTLPLTCGSPVAVLSYTRKNSSGVTVSVSTTTAAATQAVTMPASGCPCRAKVDWELFLTTTNAGAFDGNVNDGTASFATSETATPGSATAFGVNGAGFSTITYANNAVITFTLNTRSNDTGYTVNASAHALVANSGMDIIIFPSN